jgi:hypothetical protein
MTVAEDYAPDGFVVPTERRVREIVREEIRAVFGWSGDSLHAEGLLRADDLNLELRDRFLQQVKELRRE